MSPKKHQKTTEDIRSFSENKTDSPAGGSSSSRSSQPGGATASQTATPEPVRVKKESDEDYKDPHEHQFTVEFSSGDKYNINCDKPCTVLEAIKRKKIYMKMIKGPDENVIIQMGAGDNESVVATHFPCSCIGDREVLTISCKSEKVEEAQVQDSKMVHPKDFYSVFYIDTKGGLNAKKKKLFKNGNLKHFKYLCVYGEKGITVKEALTRDGRFIDSLGYFELININDKCKTECTDRMDNLNDKKFKICFSRRDNNLTEDVNHQAEHGQQKQQKPERASNNLQRKKETKSVLDEAQQRGISVKQAVKETGSSIDRKVVYKLLCEQFPRLKQWMESRFPDHSFQKSLNLRKENFGKIQQSFSEVHRVRDLLQLAESVCLLQVHISDSSAEQGTGFVLFDNFVLTNAHLFEQWVDSQLHNWCELVNITAVFNFEKQESEKMKVKAKVFVGNNELDYAILKLETEKVPPGLLKRFGPLPSDGEACIVGHPAGGVKKLDPTCIIEKEKREEAVNKNLENYRDDFIAIYELNQAIKNDPYENIHVNYNTFMYHGASGSPVFDAHGRVFGLHTGGFFYGFPKADESVIEYAFPLLTIFENFMGNLKECGDEKLLERVVEEAKGNPHLENIILSVVGPKQSRPEETLQAEAADSEESMILS
ncbi:protein FAM111A-like [Archocentrus centrarchus]|uniref:protein FAM111A-like n=1 Tax=Archocentrus centrarchus TaxID=63155 RepID=UPI0011E9F51B|nr:protein FAM111A-like [Archocentrus centrarchus]